MRRWMGWLGGVVILTVVLGTVVILTKLPAPFRFLDGHKPLTLSNEEKRWMQHDKSQWLFYCWEGDYKKVKERAAAELLEKGYHVGTDQPGYIHFLRGPNARERVVIEADSERALIMPHSLRRGWVAVAVYQEVDESLLDRMREWLGL